MRSHGWVQAGTYGAHSDVYIGRALPEILLPRTAHLADYPSVVSRLITVFANVAGIDQIAVYEDILAADPVLAPVHVCWNCQTPSGPILVVWCPDGPEFATVCLACWALLSDDEDRYGQQRIIGVVA